MDKAECSVRPICGHLRASVDLSDNRAVPEIGIFDASTKLLRLRKPNRRTGQESYKIRGGEMITISRHSLYLLTIAIGLFLTVAVYYTMHTNPRWDWTAPGVGKLPRDMISEFMEQAYNMGQGGIAQQGYFSKDALDNAPNAEDRRNGEPISHEVLEVVAQGMTVIVFHRVGPARGEAARDLIDVFRIKDGRIVRRDRYPTKFIQ